MSSDIAPSTDGYLRLPREALGCLRLAHLCSGLHEDAAGDATDAPFAGLHGYTEWTSDSTPTVSIGWDWHIDVLVRPVTVARREAPLGNLMLLDESGRDLGPDGTASQLGALVDRLAWQRQVLASIGLL